MADIVKPHPGVVPTGQHSHLQMCHPLLSEIEKSGGHLPSSTQSKHPGSQDDDEQCVQEGDTEPQHVQGVKRKSTEEPDTPTKEGICSSETNRMPLWIVFSIN